MTLAHSVVSLGMQETITAPKEKTIKELHTLTGGLSNPSKMPGLSWGISARMCIVGSLLAKIKGSVCHICYALKGMYVFPSVKNAHANRWAAMGEHDWEENMTQLIQKKYRKKSGNDRVFRWFDSGDIQSVEMLSRVIQVCKNLPDIKFWIPTKQANFILAWKKEHGEFPSNVIVRVSMGMIGQKAGKGFSHYSTVGVGKGFQCKAPSQEGFCDDPATGNKCRACWTKNVRVVNYHAH